MDLRSRAYVECPNSSADATEAHLLPATYVDYGDPLVIGLVGRPKSGKTHLFVALINELTSGAASRYGLTARAVDWLRHEDFKRYYINPFLRGERLSATGQGETQFAEWLIIESSAGKFPVVFFDVGGEDFKDPGEGGRNTRFLLNAGALMFIEDAGHVVSAAAEQDDVKRDPSLTQGCGRNEWIEAALQRLSICPDFAQLPTAIVLSKADRLRYIPPVDRWIRDVAADELRVDRMLAESRDVYALLDHNGATQVASLYQTFDKCTLHVASATGIAVSDGRFPRGVRPARVLQPLIALLAMAGLVAVPGAGEVGR
jgi:hypothetical protein